jgi:hypothetical protein
MTTKLKKLEIFRDYIQKLKLFLLDYPFYLLKEFFIFEEGNKTIINNTR